MVERTRGDGTDLDARRDGSAQGPAPPGAGAARDFTGPPGREPGGAVLLLAIAVSLLDRPRLGGRRAVVMASVLLVLVLGGAGILRAAVAGRPAQATPSPVATVDGAMATPVAAPSPVLAVQVTPLPAPSPTALTAASATATAPATVAPTAASSPAAVIPPAQRGYVPILSYHHVRDWEPADREQDRPYIMPPAKLEAELRYLREQGYQSVSTAQVYAYYAEGKPLPPKPILLSFDDSYASQYTNAVPLLKQYGFSATFFIMTVPLDKPNFMSKAQLRELDREGFDIQAHTWDHQNVTKLKTPAEWQRQLVEPKKELETILGHPVPFFAYPFGAYDAASAAKVKETGYLAAFALSDVLDPAAEPLFAIKRFIANAYWTQAQFVRVITTGVN